MSVAPPLRHEIAAPSVTRLPRRSFAAWIRWLHIYLSMLGLIALLFFSVTGITLNHPDWFVSDEGVSRSETGELNKAWLDAASDVDKVWVVEYLRQTHGIHGALAEFAVDDAQCIVAFKGPGYSADAFVDRETGSYELTEVRHGWVAILNDLHKGRDSGTAWKWLIDMTAVLVCVFSLTGLVLLFYLKRRRISGSVIGVFGGVLLVAIYLLWVP